MAEAWPTKQFVKVRVQSVQASIITFLDVEDQNRVYLWERPSRNKKPVVVEQGQLVTLLTKVVKQESRGDRQYCTLKQVKLLS